jgi:hypothetical protein
MKMGYTIFNQNNYAKIPYPNSGNKNANIKTSGCGVVSMAMILVNLAGVKVSVSDLAKYSIAQGARASAGTNMRVLSKAIVKDYPALEYTTTNDEEVLKEHLEHGGMAIMNADGNDGCTGIFAYGGHYLAILGLKNGKPLLADPAWTSSRYQTAYRKKYVTDLGGGLITCDWYVLNMDTKYRSPNYYLFKNTALKVAAITEEEDMYKNINEVPEWGKEAVQRRMAEGFTDGENLTESMVRVWVVADRQNPFYANLEDVPDYWLEDAEAMVANGVILGDGQDQVAMTRSELKTAVIAYRLHKLK